MKKLIGIAALAVIVVAIGLVWWTYSNLDGLVKDAIERHGGAAAGTPVVVEAVSLSLGLDEAGGVIQGISLRNPEGFPAGNAIRFGRIEVEIEAASLSSNPIIIRAVRLLEPEVTFIMNAQKKSNFDVIRENLQRRPAEAGPPPAESGDPTRILIREFVLGEGKIQAQIDFLGGDPISLELDRAEERDLGAPDGALPEALARQLLNRVSQRVVSATARRGLQKLLEEKLGGESGKTATDLLKSIIKP